MALKKCVFNFNGFNFNFIFQVNVG